MDISADFLNSSSYQNWRIFFAVAASWNLIGAVGALIAPRMNLEKFYGIETDDDNMIFLNRAFWWVVFLFGCGYLAIAYSPIDHVDIIFFGIAGKIMVAINWFYLCARGRARIWAFLAALGDSIFTIFFILFLLKYVY
jgi:lipid-A-disaccharide synthase-like uncharacterized protein